MKAVSKVDNANVEEGEPDLFTFSFNGQSGSFVFDESMNIVQVPFGNLKIESNFTSTEWNFKITDASGIIYYFGGNTATEKSKRTTTCGKSFDNPIPTAWYLKKIQHLNGDEIIFYYQPITYSYDTGISETMYWGSGPFGSCQGGNTAPAVSSNSICKNKVTTYGVTLESIRSDDQRITFIYDATRNDCNDALLTEVRYIDPHQNVTISKFTLDYSQTGCDTYFSNAYSEGNSTPFLSQLFQFTGTNTLKHQFIYDRKDKRPPRLSFAQDHWGFFNGKHNSTLIPASAVLDGTENSFTNATADREVDSSFNSVGLLCKVTYPTGGMDSLIYESNKTNPAEYGSGGPKHELTCSETGTGEHDTEYKELQFSIDALQKVEIDVSVVCNLGAGACDPTHHLGRVEILMQNGNGVFDSDPIHTGISTTLITNLGPGNYKLKISANGTAVTNNAKLKFYTTVLTATPANKLAGGARVKALLSSDGINKPMIKKYYYGELENLNLSSAQARSHPKYSQYFDVRNISSEGLGGAALYLFPCYQHVVALHSNSLMNLVLNGNNIVSYATVVESNGENFEGGGILTRYYDQSDRIADISWGNEIPNAPVTNISVFYNGKVTEESILKKKDNNIFPVKKSVTNYYEDVSSYKVVPGYVVNQKYSMPLDGQFDTTCYSGTTIQNTNFSCLFLLQYATNSFDMARYDVISPWTYVQSTEQIIYDENGQNPLSAVTNYFYQNPLHQQITKTETVNSKGETITTNYTYPHDYHGTAVYDSMVSHNIITARVETNNLNNGVKLSGNKVNYIDFGNGNYLPASIESYIGTNPSFSNGTFDHYSNKGDLLQYTDKTGVKTSMIWGYNRQYPVAKVIGINYQDASNPLTGNNDEALQSLDGNELKTELNRIRTSLPAALVTSYTYKPMVGVTSITDPNNKTNSYEYDAVNRLVTIKDQDGNIVKHNQYIYAASIYNKPLNLYFNGGLSGSFYCQSCLYGFNSLPKSYSVTAKKYYSTISQEDADAKAAEDLAIMGQQNADMNGTCKNDYCVGGAAYKMIDCNCEKGDKDCVSTVPNGDGTFTNTFRYIWSDNSVSTTFTEILPACTGDDKRIVRCECKPGLKWYTGSVQNGPNSYTCTFYYTWGTTGGTSLPLTYTENSTTPCDNAGD